MRAGSPVRRETVEGPERFVAGDHGQALEHGLRGDHPIERVAVVPREAPGEQGVRARDR